MSIAREPLPHQCPTLVLDPSAHSGFERCVGAARGTDIGRAYLHRLASRYQLRGRQRGG